MTKELTNELQWHQVDKFEIAFGNKSMQFRTSDTMAEAYLRDTLSLPYYMDESADPCAYHVKKDYAFVVSMCTLLMGIVIGIIIVRMCI